MKTQKALEVPHQPNPVRERHNAAVRVTIIKVHAPGTTRRRHRRTPVAVRRGHGCATKLGQQVVDLVIIHKHIGQLSSGWEIPVCTSMAAIIVAINYIGYCDSSCYDTIRICLTIQIS